MFVKRSVFDVAMAEIALVSCTKSKKDSESKPKELYMESQLFRKVRRYVEREQDNWFILSAKYGLLEADGRPISPYNSTLKDSSKEEKKEWSRQVFQGLKENDLLDENLVIHAGKDYYKHLVPLLENANVNYRIPPEGLSYGERLSWYKEQNESSE
jgi:hypothetical protein